MNKPATDNDPAHPGARPDLAVSGGKDGNVLAVAIGRLQDQTDKREGVSIYNRAGTLHRWRKGKGYRWHTECTSFCLPGTEIADPSEALRKCKRCYPPPRDPAAPQTP